MTFTPIVQKLVEKLDSDVDFKRAMQASFDTAYATGISEFDDFAIHSLEDYFKFMDHYVNWIPSETRSGSNFNRHMSLLHFILDQPPVREYQNLIDPYQRAPWRWLSEWLIEYAQESGKWMDTEESISHDTVETFRRAASYHMEDYPEPRGGWKTFNEFFARHIDPAVRPVASPDDDTIIVSPADCTYAGQWPVNDKSSVTFDEPSDTFHVKGVPWTIGQLLDDTEHGPKFAGGIFTHSFLDTRDYHRQHAPVSGTVVEAKIIPGLCYLDITVQRKDSFFEKGGFKLAMHRHIQPKEDIDTPNTPGYQFLQARGLVLIDNPVLGLVAVLPIGMAQVSSVVLSVQKGDTLKKGDEISYFQFGGSDIIMVFQKNANVKIDQSLDRHYNYGTRVAVASPTDHLGATRPLSAQAGFNGTKRLCACTIY